MPEPILPANWQWPDLDNAPSPLVIAILHDAIPPPTRRGPSLVEVAVLAVICFVSPLFSITDPVDRISPGRLAPNRKSLQLKLYRPRAKNDA